MLNIKQNTGFKTHNTSRRWGKIEWLVIHYVGATGDAELNVKYYNLPTTKNASADFFVGHKGDVWQYNPDPKTRYCWAVGGSKYANGGGMYYGKVTNKNSIHIEMCVKHTGGSMDANSPGWKITDETLAATIDLTKYLMDLYGIPTDKVIRHFDVNGKPCPGVVGWNPLTGSVSAWKSFHAAISTNELTEACKKLAAKGIIDSPAYWAKGTGYSDANTVQLIKKFANALK